MNKIIIASFLFYAAVANAAVAHIDATVVQVQTINEMGGLVTQPNLDIPFTDLNYNNYQLRRDF